MTALSAAIRSVLADGRTLLPDDEAADLARHLGRVVAPYEAIVTDMATRRAPLDGDEGEETCGLCHEDLAWVPYRPDPGADETWHASTCEWRRSREVCGHPEFREGES